LVPADVFEEREIQTPKGTNAAGSQNHRAAWAIGFMTLALPLVLSNQP
jgi:hypothetical protein